MNDPRMTPTNDAPVTVEPDWLNADTCIENMRIAYDDATEESRSRRRAARAAASAPAGDGVEDREAQALADRLTKNQRAIIEGREYTDIDSRRARTRARSDVRSMGLVWSEGDGLTPLGKRLAAALARPRAAVGEQSREAIAAIIAKHVTAPEENAIERYRLIFEQERLAAADEIIALEG